MLKKDNFTKENIYRLRELSGNDPSMIEKAVYAFGLLEALVKVGMPFIFKGGTCLMLLLKTPRRLSTDIDIIIEPDTIVDEYIREAGELFPFISQKEDIRKGKNNIEKRHYEFTYNSPINNKPLVILLDILFERNNYESLLNKEIKNSLLLTEGQNLTVMVPDINSILGDKLTAFAPHTTGIPFGVNKELEIVKQLFDCNSLLSEMNDFKETNRVFNKVAIAELGYRGKEYSVNDVLKDIIACCFCIISKGAVNKEEYLYFSEGIRKIGGHIFNAKFNGDIAALMSCEVLYLATCIYTKNDYQKIEQFDMYANEKLNFKSARSVNYLRKVDLKSYAYLVESVHLLGENIEDYLVFQ